MSEASLSVKPDTYGNTYSRPIDTACPTVLAVQCYLIAPDYPTHLISQGLPN
jgi:hypothetical protein